MIKVIEVVEIANRSFRGARVRYISPKAEQHSLRRRLPVLQGPVYVTGPTSMRASARPKFRTSRDRCKFSGRLAGVIPGKFKEVFKFNLRTGKGQYINEPVRGDGKGDYGDGHDAMYKDHRRCRHDHRFTHGAKLAASSDRIRPSYDEIHAPFIIML